MLGVLGTNFIMVRICLVSCSKRKRSFAAPASQLYVSRLFTGASEYAKTHFDMWYILSALHGLVDPNQLIEPYDFSLNHMKATARKEWAKKVFKQLCDRTPTHAEITIFAGKKYRDYLIPLLTEIGYTVSTPLAGYPLGKQLQWFAHHRNGLNSQKH